MFGTNNSFRKCLTNNKQATQGRSITFIDIHIYIGTVLCIVISVHRIQLCIKISFCTLFGFAQFCCLFLQPNQNPKKEGKTSKNNNSKSPGMTGAARPKSSRSGAVKFHMSVIIRGFHAHCSHNSLCI